MFGTARFKGMLFLSLSCASLSIAMDPESGVNNWASNIQWGINRVIGGAAKTIVQNPITSSIGAYFLIVDREAIKNNTFWSAVFGACVLGSLIKNIVSPKSQPKNFIARTICQHPFFSFCAGHMLLFHRDSIKHYPIESFVVASTLLRSLASNYDKECEEDDGLIVV